MVKITGDTILGFVVKKVILCAIRIYIRSPRPNIEMGHDYVIVSIGGAIWGFGIVSRKRQSKYLSYQFNTYSWTSTEAAGIIHNGLYSVSYVRIAWAKRNGFRFPPSFLWKDFVEKKFHDVFHFGVRQRSQKLILYQILYAYLNFTLTNEEMAIVKKLFRNCICDVTH